ncbi:isocitrate/isopropylmalate dehydrogenase family protein [Paenibacillus sp. BC26]|uniref:isocitrate/isopropylmalate dehydrogenase family protein n=1 Tax=Paenibacillus sp. BC26 TaxID=1881032 RepID=UPI0008EDF06B|nr:isocitrate/isopropylmalate family dehydrogenase [Paenibacillus sp. BC26]SFT05163.1 3-isopropylmalate dehydrogenase [Paenibacillus sp. BC26]
MRSVYRIGVMEGDGIGPEIVAAALNIIAAAERRSGAALLDPVPLPMGLQAIREYGDPLPQLTKETLLDCCGWIMGPHDSVSYPAEHRAGRNPSGELRHAFDLFANIRPNRTMSGIASVAKSADLVIYRENTEGFYADRNMASGTGEWQVTPDLVITSGVFTRRAAERIAHAAFRAARLRRKRVSIVHKANVIKLGYGLFLGVCREVAAQYPDVEVDDYHIDAACARLVRRAADFDVILTTNMFGDILSDLAAELVGSLGIAGALNAGDNYAMAQAAHGSAPDIAGRDIANPIGMLISSAMLLDWLAARHDDRRLSRVASRILRGVETAVAAGVRTADLNGTASTRGFAEAVIAFIGEQER